jgi:hypothetical protein
LIMILACQAGSRAKSWRTSARVGARAVSRTAGVVDARTGIAFPLPPQPAAPVASASAVTSTATLGRFIAVRLA